MRADTTGRWRRTALILIALAMTAAVAGCGNGDDDGEQLTPASPPSTPDEVGTGADGATPATVAPDIDQAGPDAVLLTAPEQQPLLQRVDEAMTLSYLQRRFGELIDLSWADPLIAEATEALEADAEGDQLRFASRFLDGDANLPDSVDPSDLLDGDGSAVSTDAIVALSLWCDQIDLPDDYLDLLRSMAEFGGYELTHGLGGVQLMIENGCIDQDQATQLIDELADPTAELLEVDSPADLELEACAILAWTGRWDLIPEDFPQRVAEAQLPDGGWPLQVGDTESDRHATVWGLRCALELEFGAEVGPARWIPG